MPKQLTQAQQVNALLEKAGLSQRAAARELGIDERTMRRYCLGEADVPLPIIIALNHLRIVYSNERIIDFVRRDGAKLRYKLVDGSDVDVSEQEARRLESNNVMLKAKAKEVARKK